MKQINPANQKIALEILNTAFQNNPGVLWVVKNDSNQYKRITELCKYCLTVSIEKKGAYISSNKKGVALIFESPKKQKLYSFLTGYYRLGQYCIGWSRAIKIIRRERKIQQIRPNTKHLYFWMLGVKDRTYGLDTIKEIRDFTYALSYSKKLPIYAETTDVNILNLYLRYGFTIYDKWETGDNGVIVYFIQRNWNQS